MSSVIGIPGPDEHAIRAELDRILASEEFCRSERRSRLLKYLVQKVLAGEPVKEYVIGVEAFEKDPDYDPRIDPVVRVEMGRVRLRLAKYYGGEGRLDPVRIDIPKGSYQPVFQFTVTEEKPGAAVIAKPIERPRRRVLIAAAICVLCLAAVSYRFLPGMRRASSLENPEVWELCTKARFFWSKRTPEAMRTSLQLYQQAIRLQPRYAPAYAGEAMCFAVMATASSFPADEMGRSTVEAAKQAIALDPNLAEAYAALGMVAFGVYYDWKKADADFSRALELNPGFATAHQWYGLSLLYAGRFDEASREMKKAIQIDPVSMALYAADGMVSYYARCYDEAIATGHKLLEMDPSFRNAHVLLGVALEAKHEWTAAEREYNSAGLASSGDAEALARLGRLYASTGRKGKAEEILRKLLAPASGEYVDPYQLAYVYTALGRKADALDWLAKAVHQHTALTMKVDPYFDPLRQEPEFNRLLAEANLADAKPAVAQR